MIATWVNKRFWPASNCPVLHCAVPGGSDPGAKVPDAFLVSLSSGFRPRMARTAGGWDLTSSGTNSKHHLHEWTMRPGTGNDLYAEPVLTEFHHQVLVLDNTFQPNPLVLNLIPPSTHWCMGCQLNCRSAGEAAHVHRKHGIVSSLRILGLMSRMLSLLEALSHQRQNESTSWIPQCLQRVPSANENAMCPCSWHWIRWRLSARWTTRPTPSSSIRGQGPHGLPAHGGDFIDYDETALQLSPWEFGDSPRGQHHWDQRPPASLRTGLVMDEIL